MGALVIIYSLIHDSDISYVLMTCLIDHALQQTTVEFKSMAGSPYNISTFTVEMGGYHFTEVQ